MMLFETIEQPAQNPGRSANVPSRSVKSACVTVTMGFSGGAQLYYDAVGQYQHLAGGEVSQTVEALDYSLNIVRCIINNVTWGGIPRGYFTKRERAFIPTKANLSAPLLNRSLSRDLLRLADMPPSTTQSVVCIEKAYERGQYTTKKKFIEALDY